MSRHLPGSLPRVSAISTAALARRWPWRGQADSFGHTAGLPEVFNAAGIDSFAFTRPDAKVLPLREPAFWWEGASGSRVLSYRPLVGWYGPSMTRYRARLDGLLVAASKSRLKTVACFYGVGNHGGRPHTPAAIRHSQLVRTASGSQSHVLGPAPLLCRVAPGSGVSAAVGHSRDSGRVEFLPARLLLEHGTVQVFVPAEREHAFRAEKTDAVISGYLRDRAADLSEAWRGVLFNSFHDILPGSSLERAVEDQTAWTGQVLHISQKD